MSQMQEGMILRIVLEGELTARNDQLCMGEEEMEMSWAPDKMEQGTVCTKPASTVGEARQGDRWDRQGHLAALRSPDSTRMSKECVLQAGSCKINIRG